MGRPAGGAGQKSVRRTGGRAPSGTPRRWSGRVHPTHPEAPAHSGRVRCVAGPTARKGADTCWVFPLSSIPFLVFLTLGSPWQVSATSFLRQSDRRRRGFGEIRGRGARSTPFGGHGPNPVGAVADEQRPGVLAKLARRRLASWPDQRSVGVGPERPAEGRPDADDQNRSDQVVTAARALRARRWRP